MNITQVGIDLAKIVFQVHGIDARGKVGLRKQLRRSQVIAFFAQLPSCLILQQQIRQLRLADPVIERGAQLDEFRLLLLGRERRQVQLVIDLEVTGLDGLGDGGNAISPDNSERTGRTSSVK